MSRDQAIEEALKALDQRARRSRLFSQGDGGQTYQRCLQAIEVLTQMQGDVSALPMFAKEVSDE